MKRIIYRIFFIFMLSFFLLFGLISCKEENGYNEKNDKSLQNVLDSGKLILGLDMAFPPMGFVNTEGEVEGFDIDVAREVCNRLGVELVLQEIDWNEKENDLNEGRIDCIWNGMSYTTSRNETMCLSDAYMKNEQIFIVPSYSEIKTMRDLTNVTIGVQAATTSQEALEAADFYPEITMKTYKTAQDVLTALANAELDVALTDSVVAFYFIMNSVDVYYILSDSLWEEDYVIGFRKYDIKLKNRVQEIIKEMKTDGTLATISKKWFDSDITVVR